MRSIRKVIGASTLAVFLASGSVLAQTQEVEQARAQTNKILADAGNAFREGLEAYKANRRSDAGEKFDRSVETFLYSTINIQKDAKLTGCYNQLIETVYRLEFPTGSQAPRIRELSATCGWTWNDADYKLADDVVAMAKPASQVPANNSVASTGTTTAGGPSAKSQDVGFNNQEFEPSPLDDLAKLELTATEQDVNSPVAQQQYQYAVYAIANKSLGFSFQMSPMVQQYVNYYQGRGRTTMEVGLYRSGLFMRMARRIFKEEGVPENVAWLGQVESTWKPTALSWAAASGLWQFIPGTGARFGLQRTAYVDERNSFDEATRASARYLKFLFNRYGNWELAMAAYNSGEGNVDRAVKRAGVNSFWVAYPYLPQETRNYVPNILATILIANNPVQYGFGHIRPAPQLTYDRVRVPASTNLNLLAQASDTSVQYLRYLNPQLRSNTTPPEPYIINVPAGKANEVVAVFKRIPGGAKVNNSSLANSSNGETWQTLSNRTGIAVADLMAANPGMAAPKGKVFVPQTGNRVSNIVYSRPSVTPAASNVRVVKAQSGDTVQKLAVREKADPAEVAKFNGLLLNSVLGAGREIKIPTK